MLIRTLLVLCFGTLIGLGSYEVLEQKYENNAAKRLFNAAARVYDMSLFYRASEEVTEKEFRIFARGQQSTEKSILSSGYSRINGSGELIECYLVLREPTIEGLPKDICYDEDGKEAARQVLENPEQVFSFVRYNYDAPSTLIIRRAVRGGFVSATFNLDNILSNAVKAPECPETPAGNLILCKRPDSITGTRMKFVGDVKIEVWKAILPSVSLTVFLSSMFAWVLMLVFYHRKNERKVKRKLIEGIKLSERGKHD